MIAGMITIYHNPRCSKSRQTLALLQAHGICPTIVEYLTDIPTTKQLAKLLKQLKISAHALVRNKEADYKTAKLNKDMPENTLLDAMVKYPKLIERPIVTDGTRAVLGRPPENVLTLL